MTAAERETALLFCQRNNPEKMRNPLTLAPDQVGAHDAVVLYINRLMTRLIASGNVDVTLVVPAQDWATRFTEMQSHFPSWVTTLNIDYPGRFSDMETCWSAIIAETSRQATSRKIG